ncbi:MAG: LiaF transmembrane domain-containing protein [Anaerolineales bacterium]
MSARTIFGILLVAVGGGLLLDRAGFWDFGAILATWWPLALILIAAVQIIFRTAPLIGSLIVLAVGLVFQAITLELLPSNIWAYLWPLALITVGLWLVFARGWSGGAQVKSEDQLSSFVAFGGNNPKMISEDFSGGTVTTLFGGSEIDLREARLSPSGAELDLTAAFGGIEVIVPVEWRVVMSGLPIFGGWDNKTRYADEKAADGPVLKVSCFVAFGGIEVHN